MLFGALEMVLGKWNSEADPFLKESTYIYTLRAGRMLRFFFSKRRNYFYSLQGAHAAILCCSPVVRLYRMEYLSG